MGEEEKRQYNLGILILLVVLCWPAALIYYFTRPKVKSGPTRICQGCGRQIPLEYKACPHCGKPIAELAPYAVPAVSPPLPPPPPLHGEKFCPNCGAKVSQAARFCPSCGKQLTS